MRTSASLLVRSAALLLLGGCMISTSISTSIETALGSISDALGAISDSISSDGGGGESAMYLRDVRVYAAGYLRAPRPGDDFARGLSAIAESHGVLHWEASAATLRAVGDGLREGGATRTQLERLAADMGPGQAERAGLILEGSSTSGT